MARVSKKKSDLSQPPAVVEAPPPPAAPPLPPSKPFLGLLGDWVAPVLVGLAIIFFVKGMVALGEVLAVLALLFYFVKFYYEQQPSWMTKAVGQLGPQQSVWLLGALVAVFAAITITFPAFNWMFPPAHAFPFHESYWMLFILGIGMIFAFRVLPEKFFVGDIESAAAHRWLFGLLLFGIFLRLYHAAVPAGFLNGETYVANIAQLHRAVDMKDYRNGFNLLMGDRDAFYSFFTVFLFRLFPGKSLFFIQRLSFTVFDAAAIWVFYLLGKEIAGRRVGVLTAGLAAVSKASISKVVFASEAVNESLAVALVLLSLFRLRKNPDVSRFLQCGVAIALAIYMDPVFVLLAPLFLVAIFSWVFVKFKREVGALDKPTFLMVGSTFLLAAFYFLYNLRLLPSDNLIARFQDVSETWLPCMIVGGFFVLAVLFFPKMASNPRNNLWTGWVASIWLFLTLSYPMMTNSGLISRMNGILPDNDSLSLAHFQSALERSKDAFLGLFGFMGGLDGTLGGEAFFSYLEVVLVVLGLAFCFARPTWEKGMLFLGTLMGVSSYVFGDNHRVEKLLGCVSPLLVVAGLGLNEFGARLFDQIKAKKLQSVVLALFLGLVAWNSLEFVGKFYKKWAENAPDYALAYNEAAKDAGRSQIFLDPNLAPGFANVLYEGSPVRVWHNSNVLCVAPGEKGPDVVVYLRADSPIKNQIAQALPTAQWLPIPNPAQGPGGSPALWKGSISFSDLSGPAPAAPVTEAVKPSRGKKEPPPPPPPPSLFTIRQVSAPYWDRRYSDSRQGLVFGLIAWEDKAVNANDPVSPEANLDQIGVQYRGTIHVEKGGSYQLTWKADNPSKLLVDGKKVFGVSFPRYVFYPWNGEMEHEKSGKETMRLQAGDHQVTVVSCLIRSKAPPEITLHAEGAPGEGQSLWSSFNF